MRYDSLPVHKQSLGRFPAHYTHYTIETTDPEAIRDEICDTTPGPVLSRHYSYHHIRHKIIITMSRGWWCHYPHHWHWAILIRPSLLWSVSKYLLKIPSLASISMSHIATIASSQTFKSSEIVLAAKFQSMIAEDTWHCWCLVWLKIIINNTLYRVIVDSWQQE